MRIGGLALLCLAACSGADDAPWSTTSVDFVFGTMDAAAPLDAALDAQPVARDAAVSLPGLGCPAMWGECAVPTAPWRVIAQAAQFGQGARFRALAGDLVLVEGGDAAWRVVQLGPDLTPGEPSFVRRFAFPAGAWEARALARTDGVAVIACGSRCTLLQASLEASALHEAPGAQLPAGYLPRGLVASNGALCVHGSDVSCFDEGRWQVRLAPGEDVVALALESGRAVALTQSGRVFAGTLDAWQEQARVAGVTSVSIAGRRTLFSGVDRWLERSDGDYACAVPDGVAAVIAAFGGSPQVLTGTGDLLVAQASGFCRSQRVRVEGVIAASSGACGGEPRVITDSQLVGDNRCDLQ